VLFQADPKLQRGEAPDPDKLGPDVVISPDTRRANRIPPGQSRTKKWPVLDAAGPPKIDLAKWRFSVDGLVRNPLSWTWKEFNQLPRVNVYSDVHCVTRWSRLGNLWEGISTREIVRQAGGLLDEAHYVICYGYDYGWTTNLPVDDFLSEDALIALTHDGEPLSMEHGGPARGIVPQLYAWKGAKWIAGIEFVEHDRAGFWERNGYHMHGNPWSEERFGY
jgi:DMSO/TMAO reductase YedYZ molybdopterin-dependent catalytic subunit